VLVLLGEAATAKRLAWLFLAAETVETIPSQNINIDISIL
jgi:hypothetical protein